MNNTKRSWKIISVQQFFSENVVNFEPRAQGTIDFSNKLLTLILFHKIFFPKGSLYHEEDNLAH
jgi:hypothetical protein